MIDHSYSALRSKMKKDQVPFELTHDEYRAIQDSQCYFCSYTDQLSVCRKKDDLGFIEGNVIALCKSCRYTRRIHKGHDEYQAYLARVVLSKIRATSWDKLRQIKDEPAQSHYQIISSAEFKEFYMNKPLVLGCVCEKKIPADQPGHARYCINAMSCQYDEWVSSIREENR